MWYFVNLNNDNYGNCKIKKKLKQDNSISVFDIFVGIYNKANQF